MAKANGCSTNGPAQGNSVVSIHSKYTRTTELRRVDDNDIYRLATILDINACWRKLMAIIPKGMDAQASSAAGMLNYKEVAAKGGLKYTAQHISLIDSVAERLPPDQSISQVMIDEWKTSGKLNERPTVGVLLQLLVQSELYSAADFVAVEFLNESKPERPAQGPAAHIGLGFSADDLYEEMDVDNEGASFQPNTTALNAAAAQAGGSVGMNLDYFDKHMVRRDKSLPQHIENGSAIDVLVPPIAPPRAARSLRQLKATASNNALPSAATSSATPSTPNVPILSILNASIVAVSQDDFQAAAPSEQAATNAQNIPHLSILNAASIISTSTTTTSSTLEHASSSSSANGITHSTSKPNVPLITLLIENPSCEISASISALPATTTTTAKSATTTTTPATGYMLPKISALNLNADSGNVREQKHDNGIDDNGDNSSRSSTSSLSNDDEDDDDEVDVSLPNLSVSEQQQSNNDSSLTTVTGTSGENSFELTNDSSLASNDDSTNNIPNLSELQH